MIWTSSHLKPHKLTSDKMVPPQAVDDLHVDT
jgi:hypothetical protein